VTKSNEFGLTLSCVEKCVKDSLACLSSYHTKLTGRVCPECNTDSCSLTSFQQLDKGLKLVECNHMCEVNKALINPNINNVHVFLSLFL
jgi:hypothetical protein